MPFISVCLIHGQHLGNVSKGHGWKLGEALQWACLPKYTYGTGVLFYSLKTANTLTAAYAQSSPVSGLHGCLQFSGLSPVLAGKDSVARPDLERPAPHSSLPQTFVRHLLQGWQ